MTDSMGKNGRYNETTDSNEVDKHFSIKVHEESIRRCGVWTHEVSFAGQVLSGGALGERAAPGRLVAVQTTM